MIELHRRYGSTRTRMVSEAISDIAKCGHQKACFVKVIDQIIAALGECKTSRQCLTNRLKLLSLRSSALRGADLKALKKDLMDIWIELETPAFQLQRHVMIITALYTFLLLGFFGLMVATDAILLPGFNVPYTVLLMGMLGCLTRMVMVLPNFQARRPLDDDTILHYLTRPPIAIVMTGVVFGVIQSVLPIIEHAWPAIRIHLPDESWFYWLTAWCSGFVNWPELFRSRSKTASKSKPAPKPAKGETPLNEKSLTDPDTVSADQIIDYVQTRCEGLVVDYNWGDRGIFYNPDKLLPKGIHIMTFKVKDSRNDKASHLNRDGIYRLNMGISPRSFATLFGKMPSKPVGAGIIDTKHDFRQLDVITPHPKYGWCAWIAALNPGPETFETLKPLIDESIDLARQKYARRLNGLKLPN